jgi:hypothetical protein
MLTPIDDLSSSSQSAHTLSEIASSWPYMVETSKATGGGDVPAFEWNVIDEEKDFIVEGIRVTPLNGAFQYFFFLPSLRFSSMRTQTNQILLPLSGIIFFRRSSSSAVHHGRFFDPPPPAGSPPVDPTLPPPPVKPFYCLGFFFHPSIIYLSDVSFIPEHVWAQMLLPQQEAAAAAEKEKSSSKGMSIEEEMKKASQSIHPPFPSDLSALTPPWSPIISPTPSAHSSHYSSGSSTPTSHLSSSPPTSFAPSPSHTPALSATSTSPSSPTSSSAPNLSSQAASPAAPYQLPLLILDCLFLQSHPSHFGIVPALLTTLRLNPSKTYLTGFAHHHSHAEWETLGKVIEGLPSLPSSEEAEEEEEPILTSARSLLGPKLWSEVVEWGGYVRPAYDGLRVVCPSSSSSSSKRVGELANEEDEDSENEVAVDLAKLGRELEFGGRRSRSSAKTAVGGPKREEGKASEAVAVGGEVGHAERGGCDCP